MDLINTDSPCCEKPVEVCDNSIPQRLHSRRRSLEMQLAETNAAIEAMEKNPEVATVLTLVSKAIGRY